MTAPPTTDAERAVLGAVLHLSAEGALQVLDLLRDDDFCDLRLAVVAGVARTLAEQGIAPDPAAVLALARAIATVTKPEAIKSFAVLLADLYTECPVPASARWYAAGVLDEAIRRRCAELGTRIGQAAEAEPLSSLLELVDREVLAVRELAARRADAADDPPTRLRAVGA